MEVDQLLRELTATHEAASHIIDDTQLRAYHDNMLLLMRKMREFVELIEFENDDMWRVFDEIIAHELYNISNLEQVVEMARLGYEMELPYKSFWAAIVNIALLKHSEFAFFDSDSSLNTDGKGSQALIDLVFYIVKSQRQAAKSNTEEDKQLAMNDADFSETASSTASRLIWLDVDLLPLSLKGSKSKLVRKA